jgi:YrbI family 3-deoxy-D-manno-octulosonate 8-phosphate phosphatase
VYCLGYQILVYCSNLFKTSLHLSLILHIENNCPVVYCNNMRKNKLFKNFESLEVLFVDFDGCLTDDRVWINSDGEEFVAANRKDGLAVNRLVSIGIKVVIVSTEKNKVVSARGKKLQVEVYQGVDDKEKVIEKYLIDHGLNWHQAWFIGNDMNDFNALRKAQLSICPSDATKVVRKVCDIILDTKGGYGVLSELSNLLGIHAR